MPAASVSAGSAGSAVSAVALATAALAGAVLLCVVASAAPMRRFDADTPLVIVSSHFRERLGWLRASHVPVVVCDKPGAAPHAFGRSWCDLRVNRGREAAAYLSFIVTHYGALPRRVAFVHGHERAPHQQHRLGLLDLVARANPAAPYVSLNNEWHDFWWDGPPALPGRPDAYYRAGDPGHALLLKYWDSHWRPWLGGDAPRRVRSERGAQFVVTREAILRLPREAYARWLALMLHSGEDDYYLGVAFELTWHMIFGGHGAVMRRADTADWFIPRSTWLGA